MELAEGTIVAGRFRLERRLGRGGMGAVWLARHLSLDVPCAVKFLLPDAAAQGNLRTRFEREAKAAALLRSPNVVQILDHGVWEEAPFIAMELLEGEDLGQRLRRVGKLDPHATATLVSQVARALGKAHGAGLVHRDIKPANIFIVRDEDRELVKVLDFGIAKIAALDVGDTATKTGALLGTPYYMSPEQARGLKTVDHRTDLWALAVIVFECLLGQRPFGGNTIADLFLNIITEPLPVPSSVGPVPPGFDAWWARAVDRDPGMRFSSARELSDALWVALDIPGGGSSGTVSAAPIHEAPAAVAQPLSGSISPAASAAIVASVSRAGPSRRSRFVVGVGVVALLAVLAGAVFLLAARMAAPGRVEAEVGVPSASASAVPAVVPAETSPASPVPVQAAASATVEVPASTPRPAPVPAASAKPLPKAASTATAKPPSRPNWGI